MTDTPVRKFEEDLKAYFPEIYKLHQLGKWDKWVWEAVYSMLEMADASAFGEVKIVYQRGRINQIYKTEGRTSKPIQKDGFAMNIDKEKNT